METPITYESSSKFILSLGVALLIISLGIFLFKFKDLNINTTVIIIILVVLSVILITQGWIELRRIEDAERRYKQELTVSEIIKQDLLLIDKEFKEIDYNKKIKEYNEKNPEHPKGYVNLKKIDAIVRQALNPEFYEETYLNKNKKKDKNILREFKLKLFKLVKGGG